MLVAVNFHYIRQHFNEPYPSIFGVSPAEFSNQLDVLGKDASFLSIDDVLDVLNGRRDLPKKGIVITFDDGLKEQYELAWPIMKRKGIPGIFFVNTKPVDEPYITTTHKIHILRAHVSPQQLTSYLTSKLNQLNITQSFPTLEEAKGVYKYDREQDAKLKYFLNFSLDFSNRKKVINQCFCDFDFDEYEISNNLYMTKAMVKKMTDDGMLGTHGHSHLPLGLLDKKKSYDDLSTSMKLLNSWTGKQMLALSYPFGFKKACSFQVAGKAKELGVKFAFTMERAGNEVLDEPMFLGRFSNNDVPGGKNCNSEANIFWEAVEHSLWFRSGV